MPYVGYNCKHALIIVFITIFITASFAYELNNPIGNTLNTLQKRDGDGGDGGGDGPKKVVNSTSTCASPDDPRCKPPPGTPPKVETYVQIGIETITPTPIPGENDNNNNNNNNSFITTTTTETLYFAGYTTTIITTNSRGEPTTIATSVPPSTLLVIKTIAVTAPPIETTMDISESIHVISSHSIWGVTMSLTLVVITLIFMIFV